MGACESLVSLSVLHVRVVHVQRLVATGNRLSGIQTRTFQRTFQKCVYLFPPSIPPHPDFSFLLSVALGLRFEKKRQRGLETEILIQSALDFGVRDKPLSVSWTQLLLLLAR